MSLAAFLCFLPRQVEFFDPVKGGSKGGASSAADSAAAATGLAALLGPAECAAVAAAVDSMLELQVEAGGLLDPPDGCASWKEWAAAVRSAGEGEPAAGGGAATAAALRQELRSRLGQLEAALLAESRGGLAADGDDSESEAAEGSGEASGGGTPAESAEQVRFAALVQGLWCCHRCPCPAPPWDSPICRRSLLLDGGRALQPVSSPIPPHLHRCASSSPAETFCCTRFCTLWPPPLPQSYPQPIPSHSSPSSIFMSLHTLRFFMRLRLLPPIHT